MNNMKAMKDTKTRKIRVSRMDVYAGLIALLIVLYVWSLSTPGALATASVSPGFSDTAGQAVAAPLTLPISPDSALDSVAGEQALMPVWYLAAFFIGGTALTVLQDKNKNPSVNDLLNIKSKA